MKKLMITILSATMISMLGGCSVDSTTKGNNSDPTPTTQAETPQESKVSLLPGFDAWEETEAVKALNQVLAMEATVKVVNDVKGISEEITFEDYNLNAIKHLMIYDFDESLALDNYAIVDMDHDNTPEVIVNLSSGVDGWILVLRYYEGSVYGYPFVYRGLETPKTDGSYMASSGAYDNSVIEMFFDGLGLREKVLAGSVSINDSIEYYIASEKVSEEEYNDYLKSFFEKEDVSWIQMGIH